MASSLVAAYSGSSSIIPRNDGGEFARKIAVRLRGGAVGVWFGDRTTAGAVVGRTTHTWVGATTCAGRSGQGKEPERSQPSLAENCRCLRKCFFEITIENMGRPTGMALHDFVGAAVSAYMGGHTRDKLTLQLTYGDNGMEEFKLETEGFRLTASEEQYRSQWLDTIYITLQLIQVVDNQASRSSPATSDVDPHLYSIVRRVLEGQRSGDEQSFVKFDRGLATKGASGGAIAKKEAIAPQFIPLTQLVLLTLKVVNEERGEYPQ